MADADQGIELGDALAGLADGARMGLTLSIRKPRTGPVPLSAEDLARDLYANVCYDEEASIPASVLIDIADTQGWVIVPCGSCQGFGTHVAGCEYDTCPTCGYQYCMCDAVYEREAGK